MKVGNLYQSNPDGKSKPKIVAYIHIVYYVGDNFKVDYTISFISNIGKQYQTFLLVSRI